MLIHDPNYPEPLPQRDILRLLCWNIYIGYVSNIVPLSQNAEKRGYWYHRDVQPGDLVMEISSIGHPHQDVARLGWVISEQREFMHTDEEWNSNAELREEWDNNRPTDKYLRLTSVFDGKEHRWENYRFIRVPTEAASGFSSLRVPDDMKFPI